MATLHRWSETPISLAGSGVYPICVADASRTVIMISATGNNPTIAFSTYGNIANVLDAGQWPTSVGGPAGWTMTWASHRHLVRQAWYGYLQMPTAGVILRVWEVFEWESSRPQTSGGILLPPAWDEQYAVGDESQSRASYLDALVRRGKGVIDRALQTDGAGRTVEAE